MKIRIAVLVLCLTLASRAPLFALEPPTTETSEPEELVELFSTEETPGEGTLEYKTTTETENIALGKEAGYFGLGMTFRGSLLPESFRKDFLKNTIIQIAIGTLKSKLGSKLPQFGAATLITHELPTRPTVFKFMVPDNKKPQPSKHTGFLLFTSPTTKAAQTDEEKLKTTYFAKGGTLVLTPLDTPSMVSVRTQGNKVSFKKQKMRAEFDTVLATPFNGIERQLKGTVIFPFYWPHGKQAELLTTRISGTALPGSAPKPTRNISSKAGKGP